MFEAVEVEPVAGGFARAGVCQPGAEAGGAEFVRVQAVGKAEFGKAHGAQPLFAPRFDARHEQHGGVERE